HTVIASDEQVASFLKKAGVRVAFSRDLKETEELLLDKTAQVILCAVENVETACRELIAILPELQESTNTSISLLQLDFSDDHSQAAEKVTGSFADQMSSTTTFSFP